MSRRLQTCLLLSMTVHMVLFALAGSWTGRALVAGGGWPGGCPRGKRRAGKAAEHGYRQVGLGPEGRREYLELPAERPEGVREDGADGPRLASRGCRGGREDFVPERSVRKRRRRFPVGLARIENGVKPGGVGDGPPPLQVSDPLLRIGCEYHRHRSEPVRGY